MTARAGSELVIVNYWGSRLFCIKQVTGQDLRRPVGRRLMPFGAKTKVHSATVISRISAGFASRRAPALLGLALIADVVLASCSPGADYPSLFPAVHDIPPPRTDTPLDAGQVQQATEDLISARDRLNTEAQSSQSKAATASSKPAGKSSDKSSDKSSARSSAKPATGPATAKKQPATQLSGGQIPGTDAAQTAGAETK